MAFDGDLESLPITDLIQLLHATGKSGTLTLRGPKGESQLVFDAGFIVSANHVNNSVRIGRILIDMGVLTPEELERALKAQALAGQKRAPLVATLLEAGTVLPPPGVQGAGDPHRAHHRGGAHLEQRKLFLRRREDRALRRVPLLPRDAGTADPPEHPERADGRPAHLRRAQARRHPHGGHLLLFGGSGP